MQRKPTKILAEMACAHEGNIDLALKIVAGAATAGADAIQLQLFSAAHLVLPLSESFEATKSLEISSKHWREIIHEGKRRGLEVWANVFDEDMVALAVEEGCARLKLHSTDLGNPRMLDVVGQSGKAVSLGTGGSTLDEIGYAVHQLESKGCSDMVLMHGFQAYPTDPKDCNRPRPRALPGARQLQQSEKDQASYAVLKIAK